MSRQQAARGTSTSEPTVESGTVSAGGLSRGAGWGVVATLAMTAVMALGVATNTSPIPKPVPVALVGQSVGPLPRPALMGRALCAHLGYGTLAGALLAAATGRVTLIRGLAFGVALWLVMGLGWLPYLGWGWFGLAKGAPVAGATLMLHLICGATLDWLMECRQPRPA